MSTATYKLLSGPPKLKLHDHSKWSSFKFPATRIPPTNPNPSTIPSTHHPQHPLTPLEVMQTALYGMPILSSGPWMCSCGRCCSFSLCHTCSQFTWLVLFTCQPPENTLIGRRMLAALKIMLYCTQTPLWLGCHDH